MWPRTFPERLQAWAALREHCATADTQSALTAIDAWWQQTPWCPYHLHWDDRATWPDPWQLWDDNMYCSLARALGIMYTIAMFDRKDLQDAVLFEAEGDNLVQVASGKYILNWYGRTPLNISPSIKHLHRCISQQEILQQIQ
jgi:hypothetical protein